MKTEWTVQRIIELFKRHDSGMVSLFISQSDRKSECWQVNGWMDLEAICDELNARDREQS